MAQLNVELIVRQGTAEEWGSSSYVLKSGEWGYDTTNKIIKIGDGTSLWAALTAVSMTDTNTTYTFAEGSENGTFIVTPSTGGPITVSIHGLGSAAYTDSSAYATAAQGVKADSAYQKPADGIPATDLAAAVLRFMGLVRLLIRRARIMTRLVQLLVQLELTTQLLMPMLIFVVR